MLNTLRWLLSYIWRIAVFTFYTIPSNTFKILLIPLTFLTTWVLPSIMGKESPSPPISRSPQAHDFDEIYKYKTLEEFGYKFHGDHMVHSATNKSFEFDVYNGDREMNQIRYERIGEAVEGYVYEQLQKRTNLNKVTVPIDADENESKSFIFTSNNLDTCDKLILIIHGAGVVRAGQWSRRLIINQSLTSGSQFPYIERAHKEGYGIIVTNSNLNRDDKGRIRGNGSPQQHFNYVWKEFVQPRQNIKHIAIVAHSYGGVITVDGALQHEDLINRVFAIAFTDSVHSVGHRKLTPQFKSWFQKCAKNWVSSDLPLNEKETNKFIRKQTYDRGDCIRLSAGTGVHEETSWKAFEKIWEFIDRRLEERLQNPEQEFIKPETETGFNLKRIKEGVTGKKDKFREKVFKKEEKSNKNNSTENKDDKNDSADQKSEDKGKAKTVKSEDKKDKNAEDKSEMDVDKPSIKEGGSTENMDEKDDLEKRKSENDVEIETVGSKEKQDKKVEEDSKMDVDKAAGESNKESDQDTLTKENKVEGKDSQENVEKASTLSKPTEVNNSQHDSQDSQMSIDLDDRDKENSAQMSQTNESNESNK